MCLTCDATGLQTLLDSGGKLTDLAIEIFFIENSKFIKFQIRDILEVIYNNSEISNKYIISPEGNGIDCHRHYEALLAGCIPIMEKNPLAENKYANLPILWTIDYSEINNEYLESKYIEMLDLEYDFSSLFLNNYDYNIQNYIKDCGNFWIYKLTGVLYYK